MTYYGAHRDVAQAVTTHLFGISPNHSGSTFLKEALGTSKRTWSLLTEGQMALGFSGPTAATVLWADDRRQLDWLADPAQYNWPLIRKTWYFQAQARDPAASVFYTKSPPHLLIVGELARRFRNAKFLFMVRNPYAVCESLCRYYRDVVGMATFIARFPGRSLPETAAAHVMACLHRQRLNLDAYGDCGVFFTYEEMCAEPERVAHAIQGLVPEIDDLNLQQRLWVKGEYNCFPIDFNAQQISRLNAGQVAACNRVFRQHRDTLDYFGYDFL